MADDVVTTEDGFDLVDENGDVLIWGEAVPVPAPAPAVVVPVRHVVPSRLRGGRLTFIGGGDGGPVWEFGCNMSAVRLVPTFTSGSGATTICGRQIKSVTRTSWTLTGDALSDFSDAAGFVLWAYQYAGQTFGFEWLTSPSGGLWRGIVRVSALPVGGDVGARLMVPWEWPVVGTPTQTFPVVVP